MGSWSDILWDKLANSSNVSGIKPEDNPSGIGPECGDMDKPDDFGDNPYNDKPYSKNYNDIKQPPKIASRDKLSYVVHQKGHHNSSGELAEWVVKSHDSGKARRDACGRRPHHPPAGWRADEHLRRLHQIPGGRHPARHLRRPGIRHRLEPRLGGKRSLSSYQFMIKYEYKHPHPFERA